MPMCTVNWGGRGIEKNMSTHTMILSVPVTHTSPLFEKSQGYFKVLSIPGHLQLAVVNQTWQKDWG